MQLNSSATSSFLVAPSISLDFSLNMPSTGKF